jgi:Zn-dependent M28 family amino/carboxypeptidase
MKTNILSVLIIFCVIIGCNSPKKKEIKINETLLLENIKELSSDAYEGRGFSKSGNYKAQELISSQFKKIGLTSVLDGNYIQEFPYTFKGKRRHRMFPVKDANEDFSNVADTTVLGGNVIGILKGKTNKIIVITGHLDHLGIKDGEIYNGADDDASGTSALFAIGDYFKNKKTNHTLIFAAVDAEEIGSLGADYLLKNFPLDPKKIVLNINMDMIAHNDNSELYASGLYHYPQLKKPLENIKSPITLLFGHDDPNNKKQDDWTFASDHRVFHKEKIPFIYFGVEDHKDYHKPTDIFENINQSFYIDAVKLIINAIENYDEFLN